VVRFIETDNGIMGLQGLEEKGMGNLMDIVLLLQDKKVLKVCCTTMGMY
jgi:hypothetical protein